MNLILRRINLLRILIINLFLLSLNFLDLIFFYKWLFLINFIPILYLTFLSILLFFFILLSNISYTFLLPNIHPNLFPTYKLITFKSNLLIIHFQYILFIFLNQILTTKTFSKTFLLTNNCTTKLTISQKLMFLTKTAALISFFTSHYKLIKFVNI